jgi:hypothetical protein
VQLDPNADKRKQMKAMGLTDEQIVRRSGRSRSLRLLPRRLIRASRR